MTETVRLPMTDRRMLLLGGVAATVALGGTALLLGGGAPATEPIPGLPGFERLARTGEITGGSPATLGLGGAGPDLSRAALEEAGRLVQADPVSALGHGGGIAFFTSAGCPLCPSQARRLAALGRPYELRPLALFGGASDRAARAMIVEPLLHDRLVGTSFRTEDAFIAAVAEEEGLPNPVPAMDGPEVTRRLALNHALAAALRLPGTPGVVIGMVLAPGLTSARTLAALATRGAA